MKIIVRSDSAAVEEIMMVLPELLVSTSLLSIAFLLWGVIGSWWKEDCRVPGEV